MGLFRLKHITFQILRLSFVEKARWGKDGGLGGKETPLARGCF